MFLALLEYLNFKEVFINAPPKLIPYMLIVFYGVNVNIEKNWIEIFRNSIYDCHLYLQTNLLMELDSYSYKYSKLISGPEINCFWLNTSNEWFYGIQSCSLVCRKALLGLKGRSNGYYSDNAKMLPYLYKLCFF